MTYEEYKQNIKKNSNSTLFARDSYSKRLVPLENKGYRPINSGFAFNPDLDTTEGLYQLASQSGLGNDANRVLQKVGGENQKFFSGGFVSDVMDVLNLTSYGMVGLLKGKGFAEGVKNRETFSDEDSLGKYGWTGKLAGFILDIVVDPLTYVAPMKQVARIPGVVRSLEAAKKAAVGEFIPIKVGEKEFGLRQGGWTPLKLLSDKLIYGFAVDKKTLEGVQEIVDRGDVAKAEAESLMAAFANLDTKVADKSLYFKETGELARRSLADLQRELPNEDLAKIAPIYELIEKNADRLVELGVLSTASRKRYADDYITLVYDDFLEEANKKQGGGKSGLGLKYRQRKELTAEQRKELKITENASVVLGATLLKQAEMLKQAELQDFLSKNVALNLDEIASSRVDVTKLVPVPDSPNYQINKGVEIDLKIEVGKLNKAIKPLAKAITDNVNNNQRLMDTIRKLEDEFYSLKGKTEEALRDAVSDIKRLFSDGKLTSEPPRVITDGQRALADVITKWLNRGSKSDRLIREMQDPKELFDEFMNSREGLALERAFENPAIMWNFSSPRQFFENVRRPGEKTYRNIEDRITEDAGTIEKFQNKRAKDAEDFQKRYGELKELIPLMEEVDLKNLQRELISIEAKYSDLVFKREGILDMLEENRLGNLAGKYLPKEVWEMVKGTFEPKTQFGEPAVLFFKHAKVIWNPAAYPRNALSAMIQNWWKLGLGPWNVKTYLDARKELAEGGPMVERMKKLGFHENSGMIYELTQNYIQSKVVRDAVQSSTGAALSKVKKQFKHLDRYLTNTYGHIDNVAKVAAFKHGISKGMSDEDALKAAYAATFNYSHVTPFIHQMRRAIWGVPFITFNLKAVPLVASTLIDAPNRISVFGKARNDLFAAAGVEGEQESEAMPDYMRDSQFMLRLPWKDSEGRSMYFDLTYILPFGAIMTGEYARDPLGTNPVLQTIKELSRNETFSGQKIFMESSDRDTIIADIFIHVSKLGMPPVVAEQLPSGYQDSGERIYGTMPRTFMEHDRGPGERNFYQNIFKTIGFNVSPFDLESRERAFEFSQRRALQQLLVQNGVLDEFLMPYEPKEKTPTLDYSGLEKDPLGR